MTISQPISLASFRELHPNTIEDPGEIRRFLDRLMRERVVLRRATNHRVEAETATIVAIDGEAMRLRTHNFELREYQEIFLNARLDGRPYFFVTPRLSELNGSLRVGVPAVLYLTERRDRERRRISARAVGSPRRVEIVLDDETTMEGLVEDYSADGVALHVPAAPSLEPGGYRPIRFLEGPRAGEALYASIRHSAPSQSHAGWKRIGLAVTSAPEGREVPIERPDDVLRSLGANSLRRNAAIASYAGRTLARRLVRRWERTRVEVPIVDYENEYGERIRGIVDAWGDTRGATAVLIPPAWGKTKETLLPLAAAILETFRRARQPVVIVRFDGIRKRGESHSEPECLAPGMENIRFTFSQGVRDIQATLDFLERSPDYRPSRTVLVSFSGASIDSRRAVALEGGRRIDGWVSVVGSADLQSMMRVISGGVDYLGGVERGVQFGFQGVLGLTVDVDTSSRDALAHKMAFLEDARRDFAKIRVPITWVHGRHDAWMNLERVRHVLSFGDTSRRRILEVPTGHQLKSSREALGIFQLIAREVSQIALGRSLTPRLPDLVELGRRRQAERDRLPIASVNVKQFWRDYLVGRDGSLGMELLTSTKTYREFIASQIQALSLREGDRVLDLGSGTGSFPRQLTACLPDDRRVEIIELDYVREALLRTRARLEATPAARNVSVRYVECDLAPRSRRASIALASNSSDAALGALLLNYLANPVDVLREVHRVLRPGGRLVLSSLKRDADISKICVEGVKELRSGLAREAFGNAGERVLDESIRMFMSDAARLLDLEELGIFQFWDPPELRQMVEAVGFEVVELRPAFGDPAQALVLTARRP